MLTQPDVAAQRTDRMRRIALRFARISNENGDREIIGVIEDSRLADVSIDRDLQLYVSDVTALYHHILRMVSRLTSKVNADDPAVLRMDASIVLEKFIFANSKKFKFIDFPVSLGRDLDLKGGVDEANALLSLSKFRWDKERLGEMTWRSFVYVYPEFNQAMQMDAVHAPA